MANNETFPLIKKNIVISSDVSSLTINHKFEDQESTNDLSQKVYSSISSSVLSSIEAIQSHHACNTAQTASIINPYLNQSLSFQLINQAANVNNTKQNRFKGNSQNSLVSAFSGSNQLIDNDELTANIVKMLQASHPSKSIIEEAIPRKYQEMFGVSIPLNWLTFVYNSNQIAIEEDKFTNKTVRRIFLASSILNNFPSSLPSSTGDKDVTKSDFAQTLPKSVVFPLTLNKDESVIVTQVINVNNIIVRLYQFNDEFINMVQAMFKYYFCRPKPVKKVKIGKIYAALFEKEARRVEAIKELPENMLECRNVDNGEIINISIINLQELENQFLKLPFQAISIKLSNLEAFVDNLIAVQYLKSLISEVENSFLVANVAKIEGFNHVTLYDVSKPTRVNINLKVINYLMRHAFDHITHSTGSIVKGTVVECTPFGEVYIQFESNFRKTLLANRRQISQKCAFQVHFTSLKSKIISAIGSDLLFYAPYGNDWFRVIIVASNPDDTVRVAFVDYGKELDVDVSQICQLPFEQDPLKWIPFLGVKCLFENLPQSKALEWTRDATQKLFTLFSYNEYLKVKVVKPAQEDNPCSVELIDEIEGSFVSLNKKLSAFTECFKVKNYTKNSLLSKSTNSKSFSQNENLKILPSKNMLTLSAESSDSFNFSSINSIKQSEYLEPKITNFTSLCNSELQLIGGTLPLPLPKLPIFHSNENYLIRIEITHAINPYNFYVRWVEDEKLQAEFEKMKKDMQEFYENEEDRLELELQVMLEKQFYAVKNENKWHRARLDKLLNPMPPMFYLVDVGRIHQIEVRNIQPLYTQFRDKPIAAIKASLSNLKPIAHDWDPIACYQFCERVRQRYMFAIVNSLIESEEGTILNLSLNQPDNNVEEMLISQKFAIKLES